jgi:hypothetical protein
LTIPSSDLLSDYCLSALLRCHRNLQGQGWQSQTPRAMIEDREELLLRWALSDNLRRIAEHVAARPRDIRSAIAFETQTYSGHIPGSVDARATLYEQELTGDPTLFVVSEPSVSPLTRRNHVLAWVLREAESLILSAMRRHKLGPDQEWIHSRAALVEQATRSKLLREVMLSPSGRRRPGGAEIRDARKSLSPLYRMAADAMLAFESIERFEPEAIKALLSSTLMAPLEDWQKLELSAGLAMGEALAAACGAPLRWKGSIAGGSEIATVGRYRIHWQKALPKRPAAQLDSSEIMVRNAAEALDAGLGMARADISVIDSVTGALISHFECKWFGSPNSANSAITDAIEQLVRYCRDSRPESVDEAELLLVDCVAVISGLSGFEASLDGAKPVGLTDFAGLANGNLMHLAERLHAKTALALAA